MALCTSVAAGAIVLNSGVDPTACPGPVVLSASEYSSFIAASTAFGFDPQIMGIGFGGGVSLFVIGLGVGWAISLTRKLKP